MQSYIYNSIGFFGDFLILLAYALLQMKKLKSESTTYSVMNLLGAICILFSLFFAWNLPVVVIEVFWIIISLYGLAKAYKRRAVNVELDL
jgi:Na+-translocating ferredoxin:NAD+ oxidoreductase RnfD subunit